MVPHSDSNEYTQPESEAATTAVLPPHVPHWAYSILNTPFLLEKEQ